MSKTVDERVVSMQFDNAQFERNVSTTMSTLDKLKQKLHLDGAAKGFDNVSTAAKKVDLSGISNSAETVGLRFNAMYTIADQALRNITNSAMMYGQKIVSALTIDPIKTGFQEYETQINAIQTILANTESKGTTLDDVNKALDELNAYADKTIYNFTEMTKNIGTFTAAGVDLDTSVSAIQGIANLAAVSGSTSQQASTAMYQLSQALSSGTVKLMDWNSVVNAGMGGEVFQNALKETARVHGIAIDDMIEKEGSFRETLSNGWLSSEILTDTLKKFTMAAEEGSEQWEEYKKSLMDSGYTEEQARAILKMANTATDAATKVKTFTQLWDVLKEAAQSGWTQTWEIIIGDFEEAKGLLTPISDFFTGIINKTSEWRNALLESALGRGFSGLKNSLSSLLDVSDAIGTVTDALADYNALANDIIRGDWGNGQARWDALAKAGYDWAHAQNLVNEQLGSTVRYETKYSGTTDGVAKSTNGATTATTELTEANIKLLESLIAMSDEQLKEKGYTEDQIKALRELESTADKLGLSLHDFLTNLDQINGRWLLINSFKNVGKSLIAIGTAIGNAWKNIFPSTLEDKAAKLFDIIAAIHRFTAKMVIDVNNLEAGSTMDKLIRSFEGLFAIIDVVTTLTGGAFKIAFKVVSGILGYFNLDILDLTAAVGDALVKFRDWIDSIIDIPGLLDKIIPPISNAVGAVRTWIDENINLVDAFNTVKEAVVDAYDRFKGWIDGLKNAENLPEAIAEGIVSGIGRAVEYVKSMFTTLGETLSNGFGDSSENPIRTFAEKLWSGIKIVGQVFGELGKIALEKLNGVLTKHGFNKISRDAISGFINGIKDGATRVGQTMIELGRTIIEKIKEILGIHSPSTVFFAIGGFIIAGLVAGLLSGGSTISETLQNMVSNIVGVIQSIDWGALFAAGMSVGLLVVAGKLANSVSKIASAFEGLGDLFEDFGVMLKDVGKGVKNWGKALKTNANANLIKSIAIAIGVLVASIVILSKLDKDDIEEAVKALAAISAIFMILAVSINTFATSNIKDTTKLSGMLLALSATILIFAAVIKTLGKMEWEELEKASVGIVLLGGVLAGLIAVTSILAKSTSIGKFGVSKSKQIAKLASVFMAIAGAMLILVFVSKILANMEWEEFGKAAVGIIFFGAVITGLIAATKLAGKDVGSLGSTIFKIGAAILLLAVVAKLIAGMTWGELAVASVGIVLFGAVIAGLIAATKLGGKDINSIGSTILKIGSAILLLAIVAKLISGMTWGELGKAIIGITALGGVVVGLSAATKLVSEKEMKRVASTILAMSLAIGVLGLVAVLLGLVNLEVLAKGVIAVGILGSIMALMIRSTKDVTACKANLIVLTVAIVAMAAAVAALSLIDPNKLATAVASLSILMSIFALLVASTKYAGTVKVAQLVSLLAVVAILGLVVWGLSAIKNPDTAIKTVNALSVLLTAFTAVTAALGAVGKFMGKKTVFEGALSLAIVVGIISGLVVLIGSLSGLMGEGWMSTIETGLDRFVGMMTKMAPMLLAFIPVTAALGLIGKFLGTVDTIDGTASLVAVIGLLGGLVFVIGELMSRLEEADFSAIESGLDRFIGMMTKMAPMLLAFIPVTVALGLLGVFIGTINAADGAAALIVVIGLLGAVAYAIGDLMGSLDETDFASIETGLDRFVSMITKIGEAIGGLVGGVLGGIGEGILVSIGNGLSEFVNSFSGIDKSSVDGIKALADAILTLTAANLLDGLSKFFSFGTSSLSSFAEQMPILANGLVTFTNTLSEGNLTKDSVSMAKNAAVIIKELAMVAQEIPNTGGLLGAIVGNNDMGPWADQMSSVANGVVGFISTLTTGNINEESINIAKNACSVIKELALIAQEIPNTGGWLSAIVGSNDMGPWAEQMPTVAEGIVNFIKTLTDGGITNDSVKMATNAADIIKVLATASKEIPNTGGLLADLIGDNDFATWATGLKDVGSGIAQFISALVQAGFTSDSVKLATDAAAVIAALAEASKSIDGQADWAANLFGDNSLASFSENFAALGENLAKFVEKLGTFTGAQVGTVKSAVEAIGALADLADADLENAVWYLGDFGTNLVTFGEDIKDFCIGMLNSQTINVAIENLSKVLDAVTDVTSIDTSTITKFSDSLKSMGEKGVDAFIDAFTSDATLAEVKSAGEKLVTKAIDGVQAGEDDFDDACDDLVSSGVSKIKTRSNYNDFKSAGKYLVEGFAAGIKNNTSLVTNAVNAMTSTAEQQARDSLLINSPSKIFMAIGGSVPEGFAKGVNKMGRFVTEAVSGMGRMAVNGVSRSIARIAAMVDSDIDVQPTIRPVVDLSEVRTGVDAIGDMMNMGASVGVMANVNGISYSMNRRGQNGTNNDVISAIDKLGKSLENAGGDSYSIGNISYAEGSDVAEALKTIVRAAKIERRS